MAEKEQIINVEGLPVINNKCVGVDVGSKSHYIAIGQKKEDVWEIGCYTEDYHNAAQKLVELGFTSVAMESTGSYWKGLYLILQDYGLEVMLTCGKFTKNVRGRKSDVLDCQWIQKLHSCGILTGSYIPDNFTEAVREISRHRKSMLDNAADYIKKMQKALRLMNIRLDNAIRDVTGKSGQTIIQAIIKGERNGEKLAELADWRVKKSKEEIAKALTGDWREDLVFELKQSYEIYLLLHKKIEESDKEIERLLKQEIEIQEQQKKTLPEYKPVIKKKVNKNDPRINVEAMAYQLYGGIDLMQIDGVSRSILLTIVSEIGLNIDKFPTAKQFAAWLGLAPNNKKTGGKVISSHTPKKKMYLANALRQAANVIGNGKTTLSHFFHRICYKKGRMKAITATAHKLAIILWNMLTKKEQYGYVSEEKYKEQIRNQQLKRMQRKIAEFGFTAAELVLVKT